MTYQHDAMLSYPSQSVQTAPSHDRHPFDACYYLSLIGMGLTVLTYCWLPSPPPPVNHSPQSPFPNMGQASARQYAMCSALSGLFRTDVMTTNFRVASRLPTSQLDLVGNATLCSSSLPPSQLELVGYATPCSTAAHTDPSIQLAQFMPPRSSLPSAPQCKPKSACLSTWKTGIDNLNLIVNAGLWNNDTLGHVQCLTVAHSDTTENAAHHPIVETNYCNQVSYNVLSRSGRDRVLDAVAPCFSRARDFSARNNTLPHDFPPQGRELWMRAKSEALHFSRARVLSTRIKALPPGFPPGKQPWVRANFEAEAHCPGGVLPSGTDPLDLKNSR